MNETPHIDGIELPTELDAQKLLLDRYTQLINIVKRAAFNSCCLCCDSCLACDALELLRKLGEVDENNKVKE